MIYSSYPKEKIQQNCILLLLNERITSPARTARCFGQKGMILINGFKWPKGCK